MPILLLPVIYFIVDIIALLMLGHVIGVLPTFLLIIITAVIGVQLIRTQGLEALRNVQLGMTAGQVNKTEVMRGSSAVIAGFMLMLPGPISDVLGLFALLPLIVRKLSGKPPVEPYRPEFDRNAQSTYEGESRSFGGDAQNDSHHSAGNTIDGEFIEHDRHK